VITEFATSQDGTEEINLTELMDTIRARADERRANSLIDTSAILCRLLKTGLVGEASLPTPGITLPEISLQPEFETREHYHLKDFLGFNDQAFIRNAYRGILKREPDEAGYTQYLGALRQGRLNKIDILARLRFSPEGRSKGVTVTGLKTTAPLRQLYRVPVLGYLLELIVGIFRLPVLVANHRRLEAHTAGQDERLQEHISETTIRLIQHMDQIAVDFSNKVSEISEAQRKIAELNLQQSKALFREQRELTEDQNRLKKEISNFVLETETQFKKQTLTDEIQLERLQKLEELIATQIVQKLQRTRMELVLQERRVALLFEKAQRILPETVDDGGARQLEMEKDHRLDLLYSSLEDQFRGTREDIKDAFGVYLPILTTARISSEILDVGCGRGEWLEVLKEAGFTGRGIDVNRLAIQECSELGLDASEADALTYLKTQRDRSLNCITAFHIVEHLPLETLVDFLDECLRALKSGGLLVLETPNPENVIVGSCNFYFDPTHRHPLPRATMQCLLESRGFVRLETLELHPMLAEQLTGTDELTRRFNEHFYGPMDYAIVAHRI
jgi:2-polyprenyl-3-methyl-5-hydroxy-6-metoxy-1,4-benzoquinol methylase